MVPSIATVVLSVAVLVPAAAPQVIRRGGVDLGVGEAAPTDFGQLIRQTAAIVMGRAISRRQTTDEHRPDQPIPTIEHQFRVSQVLKGVVRTGDLIKVVQPGGTVVRDSVEIYVRDDTPLIPTDKPVILFLRVADDHYILNFGPQTGLFIENGNSVDLPTIAVERISDFGGRRQLPLSEFLSMIKASSR